MNWKYLILFILISQLAGIIGTAFTMDAIPAWYMNLEKPWFTPPNWLFGPVWITLYTLMGISLYLIWEKKPKTTRPYQIFGVQLILNAIWSIIFFGLRNPTAALTDIIALWISILATIMIFYKHSKKAAIIMIPYLVWVSIATALNLYIIILNPF